jgi:cytochrome c-type biogenesis protein CcmH
LVSFMRTSPVQAQAPTPSEDDVNQIAQQLYCPVCENTTLDTCTLDACEQWRDLIRQQLADGWSEAEIKNYFVDQYGDRVLGEPPRRGLNWLLYVIPPIVIIAGLGLMFSKFKQPISHSLHNQTASMDVYKKQVERDLEAMKDD